MAAEVLRFVEDGGTFRGTATQLLEALNAPLEGRSGGKDWPTSPRGLSGAVRRAAPALRRIGIDVDFSRKREIGLRMVPSGTAPTVRPPELT